MIKTIATLFKEYKPFAFFSTVAAILLIIAFGLFIPVLREYFITGLVKRFPTLIVSGFIALLSAMMWICGIILQVIAEKHKKLYELILVNLVVDKKSDEE